MFAFILPLWISSYVEKTFNYIFSQLKKLNPVLILTLGFSLRNSQPILGLRVIDFEKTNMVCGGGDGEGEGGARVESGILKMHFANVRVELCIKLKIGINNAGFESLVLSQIFYILCLHLDNKLQDKEGGREMVILIVPESSSSAISRKKKSATN